MVGIVLFGIVCVAILTGVAVIRGETVETVSKDLYESHL